MTASEGSAVLADRKTRAEIRKLTAEAQQTERAANTLTLPEELPADTLDVGEHAAPIGGQAAYMALEDIAPRIAQEIPDSFQSVWIAPDDRIDRYRAVHHLVKQQLSQLDKDLGKAEKMMEDKGATDGVTTIATLALSALPLLLSALKTDTKVRGQSITIGFTPVAATVAAQLPNRNVWIETISTPVSGELAKQAEQLAERRATVACALVAYRQKHLDGSTPRVVATERLHALKTVLAEEAKATGNASGKVDKRIKQIEETATNLADASNKEGKHAVVEESVSQVLSGVDHFLAQLHTANDAGDTPLTMADAYEKMGQSPVLVLEASYAGAESIYEGRTWQADKALHLGAVVVSYVLTGAEGEVIASGQLHGSRAAETRVGDLNVDFGQTQPQ